MVWEKAHALTLETYRKTKTVPREELYSFTSQLRRAASLIPANIAEGCGKASSADFGKYLQIAFGSASECEHHLLLSKDLDLLNESDHAELESKVIEVKRMLASLITKVRNDR